MSLVSLIIAIVLVGLLLYVIQVLIPMDPRIKQLLSVVVVVFLILYMLQGFGVIGGSRLRLD